MQAREAVVAMGSWQEELTRRQIESRQRIEDFRQQLAEVQSCLEAEEGWLSQLEITQKTMQKILGEAAQIAGPVLVSEEVDAETRETEPETEVVRRGVMLVPPWEPELEISVLPRAYRDVLEVLADAGEAMRAVWISAALGRGESAAKVEGLRGTSSQLTSLQPRGICSIFWSPTCAPRRRASSPMPNWRSSAGRVGARCCGSCCRTTWICGRCANSSAWRSPVRRAAWRRGITGCWPRWSAQ